MNHESGQDQDARQEPGGAREADGAESLHEQIEAMAGELEQLRAQSLLERADLENQRKRMAREVESARRFANERLLADMLPVFDSLEATLRQLHKVTQANGLLEVAPAPGDGFDPERHQAMSVAEAPGVAPGAVVQLFQKGYVLNDRLLRPAMVVVAPS